MVAENTLCVCGKRQSLTLLRRCPALHTPSLCPSPAEATNSWHNRSNALHLPLEPLNQLLRAPVTRSHPWGKGLGRQTYLNLDTRQTVLDPTSLHPLGIFVSWAPLELGVIAISILFYISSVFLLQILSSWDFWVTENWTGLQIA